MRSLVAVLCHRRGLLHLLLLHAALGVGLLALVLLALRLGGEANARGAGGRTCKNDSLRWP